MRQVAQLAPTREPADDPARRRDTELLSTSNTTTGSVTIVASGASGVQTTTASG